MATLMYGRVQKYILGMPLHAKNTLGMPMQQYILGNVIIRIDGSTIWQCP